MEKREKLEKIHDLQADRILEMLSTKPDLTAQELNAVSKFLADNGVDLATVASPKIHSITKKLAFKNPYADRAEGL